MNSDLIQIMNKEIKRLFVNEHKRINEIFNITKMENMKTKLILKIISERISIKFNTFHL